MKNAPHKEAAKKLADALIDPETERLLVEEMRGVEPTRSDVAPHSDMQSGPGKSDFHFPTQGVPDDADAWPTAWDKIREPLAQILLSD
jgi:ABC-type Fe3+ transport system substrate-binding protein